ncbi:ATP:cob(I)alamin adenosyltransferase [Candidatus Peribacteria bacterium RIFCSPHIGHO2_02_FULL_53_20]|nr:MAG: ATP:cob(I)alamin adenosyltransferase [Candidatus Peribacteria bacterium RIFCSPHIGHO2_02_FULL_53_20]OGJ66614.1 MAG: ATP:cob(I)alamin adenosyltransferase [Candidatus Peribacteria bacterium RIFCSPLOWO2_01_FULL_53_10]OGJ70102.1 MAG: ATP:cob(I)alamin adenosyltransferase [Candidatus Peribacteria bacterium RIFCSPLOWO2_12_FULL_53_10]
MSIVTKTGDTGMTGLYGSGRVSKAHPRIEAYGTVDELNTVLGVVLAELDLPMVIRGQLTAAQNALFIVGSDLATPDASIAVPRVLPEHTAAVERWITALEKSLPPQRKFLLPSGSRTGALLHQARSVCRRAERCVVLLSEKEGINTEVQMYLNRLSDYLFLAARSANISHGCPETEVDYEGWDA